MVQVQVLSKEEVQMIKVKREEEDECCHKIYMFSCFILCMLGTVYFIVMSIVIIIHLYEPESSDLLLDSGSQNQ
jgi:hypothetical protein